MLISEIIKRKGADVVTVTPDATLAGAAGLMASAQVGALVVEGAAGGVAGLLSERDVTAAFARWGAGAAARLVRDAMCGDPTTVDASEPVLAVMARMTAARARHAPVTDRGRLAGIVSVGDLLKSRLEEKTDEARVLQDIARWRLAA